MSKLKAIINGWSNLLINGNEEQSKQRAKICAKCPHNVMNICTICTCPLPAKTRSEYDNCPINKW